MNIDLEDDGEFEFSAYLRGIETGCGTRSIHRG